MLIVLLYSSWFSSLSHRYSVDLCVNFILDRTCEPIKKSEENDELIITLFALEVVGRAGFQWSKIKRQIFVVF